MYEVLMYVWVGGWVVDVYVDVDVHVHVYKYVYILILITLCIYCSISTFWIE